jgi:hypothetical protein
MMVVIMISPQGGVSLMTNGFIRYEKKKGVEYASVYKARRVNGKKINDIQYLGRVIDKENGIYKSFERGVFRFSLEDGIIEQQPQISEKYILDFGDSFLLNEIVIKSGFRDIIKKVFSGIADTVFAFLFYRLLGRDSANCYAKTWWEGSYARILFPEASLPSQRISEFLMEVGDESYLRLFFSEYLHHISSKCSKGILIDSTGLPNDICFPLTAINNHNGDISNETRLILVVDRHSGLPLYFRYAPGNVVDVSTLRTTLNELKAFGIDVNYAIIDAGYYSEVNVRELQAEQISFVMRLVPNRKLYKDLVATQTADLEDAKNLIKYRERLLFIKRVPIDLFGKRGYAYIAEDIDRKNDEIKKYARAALENNDVSFEEMNRSMRTKGLFILISAEMIQTVDILPLYYTRQTIEQVFDTGKNNAELLPLRVRTVEGFRGHLLTSFIASAIYINANQMLKGLDINATRAFHVTRNLKCKVFDNNIIVQETTKEMNEIAKHLEITYPSKLILW